MCLCDAGCGRYRGATFVRRCVCVVQAVDGTRSDVCKEMCLCDAGCGRYEGATFVRRCDCGVQVVDDIEERRLQGDVSVWCRLWTVSRSDVCKEMCLSGAGCGRYRGATFVRRCVCVVQVWMVSRSNVCKEMCLCGAGCGRYRGATGGAWSLRPPLTASGERQNQRARVHMRGVRQDVQVNSA